MGLREVAIHAWGWLRYKPVYADDLGMPSRRAFPEAAATWVPEDSRLRLAAYKTLAAYDNNQAAELAEISGDSNARERREFGDPSVFVDTAMAHVLGREQTITVPGAEHDGDSPTSDEEMAARVQELLRDWAESEQFAMRIQQCERKAVSLGDGVYRVAWDPGKMRPTLRVHDPGFYFPVIGEDDDGGEYPTRVHFAWELPENLQRGLKPRIRRITYELDWIRPATGSGVDENGRAVRAPLPAPEPSAGAGAAEADIPPPPLTAGDLYNPDTGAISRQYLWNDDPSYVTCYLTDATWLLEDLKGPVDVDSLPLSKAAFATRGDGEVLDHLDLLIDFVPVVHLPNTVPPAEEHWGQSTLGRILQVFDELAGSDTDSSRASATTGAPILGISGQAVSAQQRYDVAPGKVFMLGEGGSISTVDTSRNLTELRDHVHMLHERAANNARLPAVALGTISPADVPSGYALQISLGPLDALVSSMRLARDHKYALLLKMVQRLYLAGQHPDWAAVRPQPAKLAFGSYTPTDKQAVLDQVTNGVDKGVLSLETGVKMLMEAGFPIDDAQDEIERIQSRQFEKARALADATGDVQLVGDYLGVKVTEPDPAPPVQLPPTTGNEGGQDGEEGSGGNTQ